MKCSVGMTTFKNQEWSCNSMKKGSQKGKSTVQIKVETSLRSHPQSTSCKNTQQYQVYGCILHPLLLHENFDVQTPTSKSL